ncbi:MAG: phosphoribosylformylglycinamidine synthase subunit PurQ [Candidatus Aenigmarchaeota archaeon]|nr:phosphoribosylformylglycinamidine synthase subunit PurQ [Candidatus Aenigmarchaeota archaeon]
MGKYRCAILAGPGANCYRESRHAVATVGFDHKDVHIYDLLGGRDDINNYDFLFMQGGFGFGDYVRAGGIEGALIRRKLADQFRKFHGDGKIILAVCNGFQKAVQAGLLTSDDFLGESDITLYYNDCGDFRDYPVHLKHVNNGKCIFTRGIEDVRTFPMRNGQGKLITKGYYQGDRTIVKKLFANDQVVFTYTDPDGRVLEPYGDYRRSWDPTGSVLHIAGICDKEKGTVLGLMPHPEARIDPLTDENWTSERGPKSEGDGLIIFANAMDYCKSEL